MGQVTLICLVLAVISIGLTCAAWRGRAQLSWRFAVPETVAPEGPARFETVLDYQPDQGQAHSPGIAVTPEGFQILWFEGSAEAQADVDIHGVTFRQLDGAWSGTEGGPFLTRSDLSAAMTPDQLVVTLGNTIQNEAVPGGVLATVASVGGWAMASIVDVRMSGARVLQACKLNLSPILGRSNLVRSPMVAYEDGSMALPAYFEMGATYGVLARFDGQGRIVDTRRMSGTGKPIQPMVVPLDQERAVAFLRDFDPSHEMLISRTKDGGQSWSDVTGTGVFNPSSPVAALGLGQGRILLALNDIPETPDALRLVLSEDEGSTWRALRVFEGDGALRYPMLRRLPGGDIVLSYSKGTKRGVVVHVFNQSWVETA